MIFDTHAHYDDDAFEEDREKVLQRAVEAGVGRIVNVASDWKSIDRCLELAETYPCIYAALGIHPSDCRELNEERFEILHRKLKSPRVAALGEIGLDYHYDEPEPELQHYWLKRQLELAAEENLPVIIHSREAAEDTFRIIRESRVRKGVIHCFSYSREMAEEYIRLGFFIGIGGVVTYKNGRKLKEVAAGIPLNRIVLETDCPYLSPHPYRGGRNESSRLTLVAEEIAVLKGISVREVEEATEENAYQLYFDGKRD